MMNAFFPTDKTGEIHPLNTPYLSNDKRTYCRKTIRTFSLLTLDRITLRPLQLSVPLRWRVCSRRKGENSSWKYEDWWARVIKEHLIQCRPTFQQHHRHPIVLGKKCLPPYKILTHGWRNSLSRPASMNPAQPTEKSAHENSTSLHARGNEG